MQPPSARPASGHTVARRVALHSHRGALRHHRPTAKAAGAKSRRRPGDRNGRFVERHAQSPGGPRKLIERRQCLNGSISAGARVTVLRPENRKRVSCWTERVARTASAKRGCEDATGVCSFIRHASPLDTGQGDPGGRDLRAQGGAGSPSGHGGRGDRGATPPSFRYRPTSGSRRFLRGSATTRPTGRRPGTRPDPRANFVG